jgi:hypothetical protein
MSLILDAGALVAIEKGDRDVVALIKQELLERRAPLTNGGVVAQVWRGRTGRQAMLARLLPGLEIIPIDAELGQHVGLLLGRSRTKDVIDAAVILIAADGDTILTSDQDDLAPLAKAAAVHVDIVEV